MTTSIEPGPPSPDAGAKGRRFRLLILAVIVVVGFEVAEQVVWSDGDDPVGIATEDTGSAEGTTIVPLTGQGAGTVFEQRVLASSDDAEERSDGSVSRTNSDLELVFDGTAKQTVGMRFTDVAVPPAAEIVAAWIEFTTDEAADGATELMIRGEDVDDSPTFSTTPFSISARSTTSASVAWAPPGWTGVGDAGPDQRTPDLSPIIQEIVDRPGWQSGNALSVVVTGRGERVAESFDGRRDAAPQLHVEYHQDIVIAGFDHAPGDPPPGGDVTFTWSITHLGGDPVSCTLDVDDDGTTDYSIDDCTATTSQDHVYEAEGLHLARFTVADGVAVARAMTAVDVLDPRSVVIAAAGDIACDPSSEHFNGGAGTSRNCRMLATSDLVLGIDPTAVLALGDNQYEDGTIDQFNQSYDLSWGRFKDITLPSVGNHEYKDPDAAGYYQYFGAAAGDPTKGYYSTDLGDWHVVALNSNCSKVGGCAAGSPQEQWLRADLAANPAACVLAFWHHPLFSSGDIGNIDWTRDLWQALHEAGADIVLVGHDHHYERFARQDADGNADRTGIREFVVGSGGRNHTRVGTRQPNSETADDSTYGVLELVLRPTSYEWRFVGEPGEPFTDSGTEGC